MCVFVSQEEGMLILSIKQPVVNIQDSLLKTDLSRERSPDAEERKESEMTLSQVKVIFGFVYS